MIRRGKHDSRYSIIPNDMSDDMNLSYEALGLLVYLIAKPQDWRVRIPDLTKRKKTGRDRCYKLLAELEEAGYIVRERTRQQGRMGEIDYVVYDIPRASGSSDAEQQDDAFPRPEIQDMAPRPEKPDTEKPDTEFQDTYKELTSTNPEKVKRTEPAKAGQPDLLAEIDPPKRKRKTALPEDKPDSADLEWAKNYWRDRGAGGLDAAIEAERFRAHHEAHGSLMLNWSAAWHTWSMNAVKFQKQAPGAVKSSAAAATEGDKWTARLLGFFEKNIWSMAWGANPNDPACEAPKALIAELRKRKVAA